MAMAIESIITSQSNLTGGNSGNGKPIGMSPTKRTLCALPNCRIFDIAVPPTTAINSAGIGNLHIFEQRG